VFANPLLAGEEFAVLRSTLAGVMFALLAGVTWAQIPEAPGGSGASPRDERPGGAHPVLPPESTAGSPAASDKAADPTAHDIVQTMDGAKARSVSQGHTQATKTKAKHRAKRRALPTPRPAS
jgi:hypothetical protein